MSNAFDLISSLFSSPPRDTNTDNSPNSVIDAQREIERQQSIIDSILSGNSNFPPAQHKALAQAYLKNYGDQGNSMGAEDGHADAVDYRRGHVGQALEWARRQAGLVPYGVYNSKTKTYDPAQQ